MWLVWHDEQSSAKKRKRRRSIECSEAFEGMRREMEQERTGEKMERKRGLGELRQNQLRTVIGN